MSCHRVLHSGFPSRRRFLQGATAALGGSMWSLTQATKSRAASPASQSSCPPEVRAALSGPWPSFRTPFTRDGEIDQAALARMLDFQIEQGKAKAVIVTPGDSLYSILTDDEIADLAKMVCRHVRNRAFVVIAGRELWTGKMVQFAGYCKQIGADMVMAIPPDWPQSGTIDTFVEYYKAVSEQIPIMFNSGYLGRRGTEFTLELVGRLCDEVPGVVAMKDDISGNLTRRICLRAHDHWALSAGGQKQNHMNMHPYGADGYLSTFITFNPEIAWRYWAAIEQGDLEAATGVIRDYDMPFFDYVIGVRGSFDAAMHGIYELMGLATRHRRPPYHALTDQQMEELGDFLRRNKML